MMLLVLVDSILACRVWLQALVAITDCAYTKGSQNRARDLQLPVGTWLNSVV